MYSLLIAIFTIIISVFITRKFAAFLGLTVGLKSLYICAACAFLVVVMVPLVPAMWSQYNLLLMFSIALAAASFVTRYNEKLILSNVPSNQTESVPLEPPPQPDEITRYIYSSTSEPEPPKAVMPSAKPKKLAKKLRKKQLPLPVAAILPEVIPTIAADAVAATIDEPANTEPAIDSSLADAKSPIMAAPPVQTPPMVIPDAVSELPQIAAERKFKKFGRSLKSKLPARAYWPPDLSEFTTLDALLDYSDQQKRQGYYENAMFALKETLVLYKNDEYAPFIVIELGNFYKNTGLYDEAIVIYSRAYSLPTVINNDSLQQEFEKNISYLRIVKTILCKHNCPQMKFPDIPADIMLEIENSFALWYSQRHVS